MRATLPHTTDFVRPQARGLAAILRTTVALAAALLLAACNQPPVNRDAAQPLSTAQSVDLQRYLGRWYEIARFPNEFEVDCVGVTATYTLNADGTIKVVNRCRKGKRDGAEEVAEGTATVVDTTTNAKLSVTFFWPFAGDYWVLDLADDYSWALVGEPSGRYLWILARTPEIPTGTRTQLIAKLAGMGYRTGALYWTPQPPASP
jgi:apolipoprotein D and lipocalin family protein